MSSTSRHGRHPTNRALYSTTWRHSALTSSACRSSALTDGRKTVSWNALANSILTIALRPSGGDPIAIFSRFPIIRTDTIHYESRANNSAAYHLLTPGGDTTIVVVNHFESTGLSKDDRRRFKAMLKGDIKRKEAESESRNIWRKLAEASAIRAPQADSVAAYVERHEGRSIILTGDFNDSPISYVRHRLASVLTDCYVASANGPGISYHYNAFYVRIDNIMCSSHWKPYACRVDNGIKASDHYPIICSLERKKE